MREVDLVISNRRGLHARAAAKLVHAASRFASEVRVIRDENEADGKSILSLMILGAAQGCPIKLRTQGSDEDEALEVLSQLIESGFAEED